MSVSKTNTTFLDSSFLFFCLSKGIEARRVVDAIEKISSEVVTNVKVLQEIVYYYHLLGETQFGYDLSTRIARLLKVHSIGSEDLDHLDTLLERYPRLKSRVLFHVGSMKRFGVATILCDPHSDFREVADVKISNRLSEMGLIG